MRTLNFKRTAVAFLVLVLVAGSTHLLHSYQVQRNASAYKIKAEDAWNAKPKRIADAVETMEDYLLLAPHDYDAREEYGGWCADCRQFGLATETLEELLRDLEKQDPLDLPRTQKVRRKLVDIALAQGRCADAVAHLEILKKQLPHDVNLVNLLGKCLVTLRAEDEAIENFSAAIAMDPQRVNIYYNKAMALRFSPRGEAGRGR